MEQEEALWSASIDELVDDALELVIQQIFDESLDSLAGFGRNATGKVSLSIVASTEEEMERFDALAKAQVQAQGCTEFAVIGTGILDVDGEEQSVLILYLQSADYPVVQRYICAIELQQDEDSGDPAVALSEWQDVDPLEESWLSA